MNAKKFEEKLALASAVERIRMLIGRYRKQSTAVLTSFGVQSGVMLSLVAEACPDLLVVFIDTQSPTSARDLAYGHTLLEALGLTNFMVARADVTTEEFRVGMEEVGISDQHKSFRKFHQDVFKVTPLARAVEDNKIKCLLSGVRRGQTHERDHFKFAEIPASNSEESPTKGHPILDWSDEDCLEFLRVKNLPAHPELGGLLAKIPEYNEVSKTENPSLSRGRSQRQSFLRSKRRSRSPGKECGIHTSGRKGSSGSGGSNHRAPPVPNVVVGKSKCRFCRAAKALLAEHGIAFDEVPIRFFTHLVPAHFTTVPIIFLQGKLIGGYQDLCQHLGVDDLLNTNEPATVVPAPLALTALSR